MFHDNPLGRLIADWSDTACTRLQFDAIVAGSPPPAIDRSSPAWLGVQAGLGETIRYLESRVERVVYVEATIPAVRVDRELHRRLAAATLSRMVGMARRHGGSGKRPVPAFVAGVDAAVSTVLDGACELFPNVFTRAAGDAPAG